MLTWRVRHGFKKNLSTSKKGFFVIVMSKLEPFNIEHTVFLIKIYLKITHLTAIVIITSKLI